MRPAIALFVVVAAGATLASALARRPLRLWQTDAEKAAIRATFALQSAEFDYAVKNGGFFDPPECLITPGSCLPGYSGAPFLRSDFDAAARAAGYRLSFVSGRPSESWSGSARATSPRSVQTYAFVATPPTHTWFGPRSVCVDSSARVCLSSKSLDASEGLCPIECDR
jgi:hypothetical protein